jgi:glycosyltransferase involved in cell wall biosynthesis
VATLNVLVLTYNHVAFIARCLDGILSQKTQHTIKINIYEDCSTDGTQDIVRQYAAQYPDQITTVLNPRNLGRRKRLQTHVYAGFRSLEGDYIALLEGDDFWSDDSKIELQIAALQENPSCMASAHNCVKIYENMSQAPHRFIYTDERRTIYNIRDLVSMTRFFHISTLIFRNVRQKERLSCFQRIRNKWCCDIYVNMLFTQYGDIYYIRRDMSVYRAHAGGSFSGMSDIDGRIFNIEGLLRYNAWLRFRFLKGFSFTLYRLTREMLKLIDSGGLPPLRPLKRLKYSLISKFYGRLYDYLDRHPLADPAVWLCGEQPKRSEPRLELTKQYDQWLG